MDKRACKMEKQLQQQEEENPSKSPMMRTMLEIVKVQELVV